MGNETPGIRKAVKEAMDQFSKTEAGKQLRVAMQEVYGKHWEKAYKSLQKTLQKACLERTKGVANADDVARLIEETVESSLQAKRAELLGRLGVAAEGLGEGAQLLRAEKNLRRVLKSLNDRMRPQMTRYVNQVILRGEEALKAQGLPTEWIKQIRAGMMEYALTHTNNKIRQLMAEVLETGDIAKINKFTDDLPSIYNRLINSYCNKLLSQYPVLPADTPRPTIPQIGSEAGSASGVTTAPKTKLPPGAQVVDDLPLAPPPGAQVVDDLPLAPPPGAQVVDDLPLAPPPPESQPQSTPKPSQKPKPYSGTTADEVASRFTKMADQVEDIAKGMGVSISKGTAEKIGITVSQYARQYGLKPEQTEALIRRTIQAVNDKGLSTLNSNALVRRVQDFARETTETVSETPAKAATRAIDEASDLARGFSSAEKAVEAAYNLGKKVPVDEILKFGWELRLGKLASGKVVNVFVKGGKLLESAGGMVSAVGKILGYAAIPLQILAIGYDIYVGVSFLGREKSQLVAQFMREGMSMEAAVKKATTAEVLRQAQRTREKAVGKSSERNAQRLEAVRNAKEYKSAARQALAMADETIQDCQLYSSFLSAYNKYEGKIWSEDGSLKKGVLDLVNVGQAVGEALATKMARMLDSGSLNNHLEGAAAQLISSAGALQSKEGAQGDTRQWVYVALENTANLARLTANISATPDASNISGCRRMVRIARKLVKTDPTQTEAEKTAEGGVA